jgi:K+-sensing histidine kinase KdpD
LTIAAAVDITAPDQDQLIAAAANFARQRGEQCFVISIVKSLALADKESAVIARNLALIASRNVAPIVQEGDDVARSLRIIAEKFGVQTLFIRNGRRRFGRTMAEQLIHLKPSFEVVVVSHDL